MAVFSKLSAIWAPIALLIWLGRTDRKLASWLAVCGMASGALLFGAACWASDGRFLSDCLGIAWGTAPRGTDPGSSALASRLVASVLRIGTELIHAAPGLLCTLSLVLVTHWARPAPASSRSRTLLSWSLVLAVLALWIVFAQDGTFTNHLADVLLLLIPCVALSRPQEDAAARGVPPAGPSLRAVWSSGLALALCVGAIDLRLHAQMAESFVSLRRGHLGGDGSRLGLLEEIPRGTRILSEHAGVAVARGERPVMLDSFLFLRAGLETPERSKRLASRLASKEFGAVVLQRPLDAASLEGWFARAHLGRDVAEAVKGAYSLDRVVHLGSQDLYIYIPTAP
jgi:hypothetical protein